MKTVVFFFLTLLISSNMVFASYFPQGMQQYMPSVPVPQIPQGYPSIPQGYVPIPQGYMQGVPMTYPNMPAMPMPAMPLPPGYSGMSAYISAPLAPYADQYGQSIYNEASDQYKQKASDAQQSAQNFITNEEGQVTDKIKGDVASQGQVLSKKANDSVSSASTKVRGSIADKQKAVTDKAQKTFGDAMSKLSTYLDNLS